MYTDDKLLFLSGDFYRSGYEKCMMVVIPA